MSDFFDLVLHDSDGQVEERIMGEWSFGASIRPYPYTQDMQLNPLTYNSLKISPPFPFPPGEVSEDCMQYLVN